MHCNVSASPSTNPQELNRYSEDQVHYTFRKEKKEIDWNLKLVLSYILNIPYIVVIPRYMWVPQDFIQVLLNNIANFPNYIYSSIRVSVKNSEMPLF